MNRRFHQLMVVGFVWGFSVSAWGEDKIALDQAMKMAGVETLPAVLPEATQGKAVELGQFQNVISKMPNSTGNPAPGSTMFTVEAFSKRQYTYQYVMAEAYQRLKAGAISSSPSQGDEGVYRLRTAWPIIGGGNSETFPILEMFPKTLYSHQYVLVEAYLRSKAGARNVNIAEGSDSFTLSAEWPIIK